MAGTIRIAIVGAGKIAIDQHLPAIAASGRFEAVAAVDQREVETGLPRFADLAALLRDGPCVDAVALCTPPQVREALAREALAAGLHVMLEKPPAATVAAAERLRAACRAGTSLFATWHSREAPMVQRAAAWLEGREIVRGTMRWREDARRWHPGQRWLWQPGGLGVFDPAINGLSILTAISRQRFSVADAAFEVPANQYAPIAAAGTLACNSGVVTFDLDLREAGDPRWEIALEMGDGGNLRLSGGGRVLALDGGAEETAPEAEYPALYARFARLIDSGASEVDTTPLGLVADAFLVARITRGEPYEP